MTTSSPKRSLRPFARRVTCALAAMMLLGVPSTGCQQEVTPVERTLLIVESQPVDPDYALTHLLVVGLVDGSDDDPVILKSSDDESYWKLLPELPPLHEKGYVFDLADFLNEFDDSDVRIGVTGFHQKSNENSKMALAGGQLVVPAGARGTLWLRLTAKGLPDVPTPSCFPRAEICSGEDEDCDGEIDEDFAGKDEICDGVDNDCDGETDEDGCDDDGIPCTEDLCEVSTCSEEECDCQGEECESMVFVGCVHVAPSTGSPCNDGDPCTVDSCDAEVGCSNVIDALQCPGCETDAGCESDNECIAVTCQACTGDGCPAGFPGRCESLKYAGTPCDDADPCTVGDTCNDGVCVAGVEKACPGGLECTVGSCDPETGTCVLVADDTLCNDDISCTEDLCNAATGTCTNPLGECDCKQDDQCPDDGNPCTTTSCSDANVCVTLQKSDDSPCDLAGAQCVGTSTCDGLGACVVDVFLPPGSQCDDGNSCTSGDACSGAGLCEGALPEEICDGIDNNCNGETDEGIPTVGDPCDGDDSDKCIGGFLACTSDGEIQCSGDDGPGAVEALCDGQDEDCDGKIDESFLELGKPCNEDPVQGGAGCSVWSCDPNDPAEPICVPLNSLKSIDPLKEGQEEAPELCDNIDNNCNGQVDEASAMEDPEVGVACGQGACAGGTTLCGGSGLILCSTADVAEPEVCNDIDDDCDGQTDENATEEVCDYEDNDCDGKIDEFIANACGWCGPPPVETCDNLDNDCDGATDEGEVCSYTQNCQLILMNAGGKGGKSAEDSPGPSEEEIFIHAMTSDGDGGIWAAGDAFGDFPQPATMLLRYQPEEMGSSLEPVDAYEIGWAPIHLAYDHSGGLFSTLVGYDDFAHQVGVFDTLDEDSVAYEVPIGWGFFADLVPLYKDPNSGAQKVLLLTSDGHLHGGSLHPDDPTDPNSWWQTPDTSGPLMQGGLENIAWTGSDVIALVDGNMLVCPGALLLYDQLPSDCKVIKLPGSTKPNTIAIDPTQYGFDQQWVLIARLHEPDETAIWRYDLSQVGEADPSAGWYQMDNPTNQGEFYTNLDLHDGRGWALTNYQQVHVFQVATDSTLIYEALPIQMPELFQAAKMGAYFRGLPEEGLQFIHLSCDW